MQIAPTGILSDLIKHFLIIESESSKVFNHRFFPDGNPGIVFYYGDVFQQYINESTTSILHPRSFLYGQVDHHFDIASTGKIGMLVVVFQPYAIFPLTGIPAFEYKNNFVQLSDIYSATGYQLEEQLLLASDNRERIHLLEQFFIRRLRNKTFNASFAKAAVTHINQNKGSANIASLTDYMNTTERQLERKFKETIGIPPKQFTRIVRLQHFLKLKNKNIDKTLTALSFEAGYFDQAHFIREFKHFAGITPSQYLSKVERLAVNLVQYDKI